MIMLIENHNLGDQLLSVTPSTMECTPSLSLSECNTTERSKT